MGWFRSRRRRDREVAEELAAHVAMRARANRDAGLGAAAAEHDASRRLGSDLALRERTREVATPGVRLWLEDALRDVSLAGRALRRSRGFTVLAAATLALGIGAATAMFSVVHTVLLDPLPFPQAQRLVQIVSLDREGASGRIVANDSVTAEALVPLQQSGVFAAVGLFGYTAQQTIFAQGFATEASTILASPHAFAVLGVKPELGRGFGANPGANLPEMLVSNSFWRHALHGDRSAIGQPLRVGETLYTLVGVLPAGMQYPPDREVWLAGMPVPGGDGVTGDVGGVMIARLPANLPLPVVRQQAAAALAVIGKHLVQPGNTDGMTGLALAPLQFNAAPPLARTTLWVLFAAVGCLLLIACANTASTLLARGLGRERELAVRRALGASRARVVRLLLAEGLWLALAGGLGGAALAWALLHLAQLGPAGVPRLDAVRLNPAVLVFAAAVALASGLACAVMPALRLSEPSLSGGLHDGSLVTRMARLRWVLVVGEVALTLVLLIGGVLLLASFNRLLHVDLGFSIQQMTALPVIAPPAPPGADRKQLWPRRQRLNQTLLQRLQALPGVEAATYSGHLPFDGTQDVVVAPLGQKLTRRNFRNDVANVVEIGPDYCRTMGIRLLAGRDLGRADMVSIWSPVVPVLINESLARRLWPALPLAAAVGKRVHGPVPGKGAVALVVGVAADTRSTPALAEGGRRQLFLPAEGNHSSVQFLFRSPLPPGAIAHEVRQVLAQVNPQLTLGAPVTLEARMQTALAQPHFRALLLDVFAVLALLLALVGLYGALAYQVRQRRREIGVRMALGAGAREVLRLVLGQSLAVLAAGTALGWLLAWFASRFIASLLFGVTAFDPSSWAAATAALLLVGLLASYLPAHRALRVDAAEVLRCE